MESMSRISLATFRICNRIPHTHPPQRARGDDAAALARGPGSFLFMSQATLNAVLDNGEGLLDCLACGDNLYVYLAMWQHHSGERISPPPSSSAEGGGSFYIFPTLPNGRLTFNMPCLVASIQQDYC